MISAPAMIQKPINNSRFIIPHCSTRSAFERNFIAIANSKKPKTTFTELSHPPDFGKEWSHPGNMANNANGNANPKPNPAIPKLNWRAPPLLDNAPANNEPRIGPVQEKETTANVSAIKKIPTKFPAPDFEPAALVTRPGNVISK